MDTESGYVGPILQEFFFPQSKAMEIVMNDIDAGRVTDGAGVLTEFQCVVRMNEGIKRVVQISARVDMAAVNAMLMSKRAGRGARGFGVVSSEMRAFSNRLDQCMLQLNAYVLELVSESAKILSIHKRHHLCTQLNRTPAELSVIRNRVVAQLRTELEDAQERVEQLIARIQLTLKRAQHLCSTGIALSRNGKIEAVQCGELAAAMALSAGEAEADVAHIVGVLKHVSQWAKGAMSL